MTIKELILKLQQCENQDNEVFFKLESGHTGVIKRGYEWDYGFDLVDYDDLDEVKATS